jgi:hypothetical protein
MATTTRKPSTQATSTTAPAPTTTTTTQATGTTTTTAQGTPQAQVPALAHLLATLPGVALANANAAWPGFGKVVRLTGNAAAAYVNRGNIDVRTTPAQAAKWAKAGLGTVRGQGQYLRLAYSATGTAK